MTSEETAELRDLAKDYRERGKPMTADWLESLATRYAEPRSSEVSG